MATQFILHRPHDLAELVERTVARHRDWWARNVHAEFDDSGELRLHGNVRSYHHKQLAQEAFRGMSGVRRIHNELSVATSANM